MRANPGGTIDPEDVVGRDAFVARLWDVLDRQSVVLSAERRMGKTCVIKKMQAEAPPGKLAIWRDVEGIRTPVEFVERIFHDVEGHLSRTKRNAVRVRKLLSGLAGTEIAGVIRFPKMASAHWKALLTNTMEDLVEHQERPVVLFWDELPLMLKNIKERADEAMAMELLDVLRELRQTHRHLRMVYTGPIGFHNIITSLKRQGYANAPINDMQAVDLPPLSADDGADLAGRLLKGEGFDTDAGDATARVIAEIADYVPYFIHHVVDQMKQRGTPCAAEAVRGLVANCLSDPQDPWQLQHYRDRVNVYYDDEDRPFALAILDTLAVSVEAVSFPDVFNLLKSQIVTEDKEKLRETLTLLQRDHYLVQQADGRFRFRFPLIQRWWRLHRGLVK